MLKEVRFKNWKSYTEGTLYIDPLTVLIGTNASGKSNALDGISFLSRIAQGRNLQSALIGDSSFMLEASVGALRGGVEWAAKKPGTTFTLEAVIQFNEELEYEYSVTVQTSPQVELISEFLTQIKTNPRTKKETSLYKAYCDLDNSPTIAVESNNGKGRPKKEQLKRTESVLSQLKNDKVRKETEVGIQRVIKDLEEVFVLDPVPGLMRDYRPLSPRLASNASNLAGMLAALADPEKKKIENQLSKYVSRLPEGDIRKVWAEKIGRFKNDAMLYCQEKWSDGGKPLEIDARGMSDGTLRFLGILTALLTRPENSLIVIEEVDNGLHPSRAHLLLEILREIGTERNIDILVTTHNPALMDELGTELIPFIVVAHRSKQTGESKLTLLEDVENLPKLLAFGPLGRISTKGYIENSLSDKGGLVGEQ